MMKLTKRKGFNFLRSYFDVLNDIPEDKDKLDFLTAIINKQFIDEEPKNLSFIANLCYNSQRHAIEKSVKGWKLASNTDMLGSPLGDPKGEGGGDPMSDPKEEQEQEKVQEKEKEQQQYVSKNINNNDFLIQSLGSVQWMQTCAMQNKVVEDVIKIFLTHFSDHLITMEEQKKSTKEFKSHFVNWLGKQDLSQHRRKVIGKTNQ